MPTAGLRAEGHEVMALFFNPNIHPYTEYSRRLDTAREWAEKEGIKLAVIDEYDPQKWLREVVFREAVRCRICYHIRLTRTAQVARRGGFDAFSTTLFYSIRQDHALARAVGEAVAAEQGVELLYRDWRGEWKQGVERSIELGMYRQNYCGCIYSEKERYLGKGRRQNSNT